MFLVRHPPPIRHAMTWRQLYRSGAFAQRDLTVSSLFSSRLKDRGIGVGIGDDPLAYLHEMGALRPIAFSRGQYWAGMEVPAEPEAQVVFGDEDPSSKWQDYAYELHDHPQVTALYSPWQQLAAGDVADGGWFTLPLSAVAADERGGAQALDQVREVARMQQARWQQLDEAWRPLLMALVRLQNRYLPDLTLRTTLLFDPDTGQRVDPYPAEVQSFEAASVFEHEFCEDRDGLLAAYEFLVERGLRLDPEDGLTMLRRARPRAFHIRWRGEARRAQDHFDAADVLRRFLADLDGHQPPQPSLIPMDGKQIEREELYRRGPASHWTGAEVVSALQQAELYPHGVHVIHEGRTDRIVVETLTASLLGSGVLDEVGFTRLGGAGGADELTDLVGSLSGYTRRVVVILDREAKAYEHVQALLDSGGLPAEDVLLFSTSLEEANATDDELADLADALAAEAGMVLSLTGAQLREFHETRVTRARARKREVPGLAISLQQLVAKTTAGKWHLRKPPLDERLALLIAEEMHGLPLEQWWRPLPTFLVDRIIPPLNRPLPAGAG
jgi:hypothetical protein